MVDAHEQPVLHKYVMHYPEHPARKDDPHYVDFEAYHRRTRATARCAMGQHRDDYSECTSPPDAKGFQPDLELHHHDVEFALQNGVELKWLNVDYPGIGNASEVGAWVESAKNLMWYCTFHHRGHGGVHVASASDFQAENYVRGLIS